MAIDPSFSAVISRLRAGDEEAAAEIFRRYVDRLIALASRQLDTRFRAKADPEDVVQSVYNSFFRRERDNRSPYDLSDWEGLWSLLATITIHKCFNRKEFWRAARRDVGREAVPGPDPDSGPCWDAIDRGPTPLQATVLSDTLEELIRRLAPSQRVMAELSFQGYTAPEVAHRCGCSERTVARVLRRIRDLLGELEAVEPGA